MTAPVPISFGSEKPKERVYNFGHGKPVDLTPEAIEQVKNFAKTNPQTEGKLFRIYVEGGGCSGFQYGFTFDEKRDDDNVISCGDISVLVDVPSLVYMKGAVVDYVADFRGAGFVVKNPQSKGECGCGTSFTV